jgi:hypothetical protein
MWPLIVECALPKLPLSAVVFCSRTVSNARRTISSVVPGDASSAVTLGPKRACSSSSATVRSGTLSGA